MFIMSDGLCLNALKYPRCGTMNLEMFGDHFQFASPWRYYCLGPAVLHYVLLGSANL
uniref:Uncharacterized protein n=1 Tax=Arundo donax TaxID=35708 RepID=A0A0A8YKZ4_ARUDO